MSEQIAQAVFKALATAEIARLRARVKELEGAFEQVRVAANSHATDDFNRTLARLLEVMLIVRAALKGQPHD